MRFQDFFRFGVINLSRRKARTVLTALSMAIGVMFGRKPIAGSCGGMGAMGLDCEFGCKKPCSKRQARLDAQKAEQQH